MEQTKMPDELLDEMDRNFSPDEATEQDSSKLDGTSEGLAEVLFGRVEDPQV